MRILALEDVIEKTAMPEDIIVESSKTGHFLIRLNCLMAMPVG